MGVTYPERGDLLESERGNRKRLVRMCIQNVLHERNPTFHGYSTRPNVPNSSGPISEEFPMAVNPK